ncbi:MAG TPA: hypothetical protein VK420_08490 [Longimicrobium sp.]|nr:hypothetical protein [Longimicrobium sp.]
MMIDTPSAAFAPLEELSAWLERCQEMRAEFGGDPGALDDIAESEREVRAALEKRGANSEDAPPPGVV